MTGRERFRETMRYGVPDRVPYFEEGLRDDVLELWRAQGLPERADLSAFFGTDRRERIPVSLDRLPPPDGGRTGRNALSELRRSLDPSDPRRWPTDWPDLVRHWRHRDYVLELALHPGFFLSMEVGDWDGFERAIYALKDDRDHVWEVLRARADLAAGVAERVLSAVDVDFVSFSEPIGGNDRPLLSPRMYRDVVLESYRPILDVLRRHHVETIVFVTYANARLLLPTVIEAGFNTLWACEVNTEAMDYLDLRREFGPALRLIGGIDLDTLRAGRAAIRREMEEKLPPLLAQGGYVPLADGRVRADVPLKNYLYYRDLLRQYTTR